MKCLWWILFSIFLWGFVLIWRYYPNTLPDFIMNYRIELFAQQSKESIDEILVLSEKSKDDTLVHTLTYLMRIALDYGIWLENNKIFILQYPALKEVIIEQLKNAKNKLKDDFILDLFENYIKVLEDKTGQVKSIATDFF